jgi:hypothetical protein
MSGISLNPFKGKPLERLTGGLPGISTKKKKTAAAPASSPRNTIDGPQGSKITKNKELPARFKRRRKSLVNSSDDQTASSGRSTLG